MVTLLLFLIYESGVFSTEFYLPVPIDGPFFWLRLISTSPLMLYLAEGETTLMSIRLFLCDPPKENPLAGRREVV